MKPARTQRAAARPGGPVSAPSLLLALLLLRCCAADQLSTAARCVVLPM